MCNGHIVVVLSDERTSWIERFTLTASNVIGSWWMIGAQTIVIVTWIAINIWKPHTLDDKQFDTLRLLLGLQSVYTAPLILMAQRKVSAKDRIVLHGIDHAERHAAKLRHEAARRRKRLEAKVDTLTTMVKFIDKKRRVNRKKKKR